MLLGVFEKRDPGFRFEGDVELDGRRLLAYSYSVPQPESGYLVKTHNGAAPDKQWIVTGYTGRLLVDPATAELVRLTVHTDELPASTGACETDTTLEYGMVALDAFDYLLPKFARQRFLGRNGAAAENRLAFASCREYRGESSLVFGAVTAAGGTAAGGEMRMALPAGLSVTVDLAAPVPLGQAAAGDRILGRLAKPVLDRQRKTTLAPEGARVEGRLMQVEVRHARGEEHVIALRWETLEIDGGKVPLDLKPNRPMTALPSGTPIEFPRQGEDRDGVYHLPGQTMVIESGFRTEWVTAAH
jgi:hypothetical protein